ncbi:hypothetical protein FRC07_009266 [Ceratobasidium sp. 392]|nr:hypothetical protein FRC07_009266 [Ceratobasidium sp. 392]
MNNTAMKRISDCQSASARHVALQIAKSKHIVVLTGAGISTAAGIPDFRSAEGLYQAARDAGEANPKDVLNVGSLKSEHGVGQLHKLLRQMWQLANGARHTAAHNLIALLSRKGSLRCHFTQNVDGLDEELGMLSMDWAEKRDSLATLVQMHGNSRAGRNVTTGYVRTDIVLYGEPHPHGDAITWKFNFTALGKPDLLMVLGTSLDTSSSTSLLQLVLELSKSIRQRGGCVVFINQDLPPIPLRQHVNYWLSGDLQAWSILVTEQAVAQLCTEPNSVELLLPSARLSSAFEALGGFVPVTQSPGLMLSQGSGTIEYPTNDCLFMIILFTRQSTSVATSLKQRLCRELRGSKLMYRFWCLEWDEFLPLDPDMFG